VSAADAALPQWLDRGFPDVLDSPSLGEEGMGMERTTARTPQQRDLGRGFEPSRLQTQVIATAYELVVPVLRRSLPAAAPAPWPTEATSAGRPRSYALGG
jgi:hypothetical protein